jgi:hypothetical protein
VPHQRAAHDPGSRRHGGRSGEAAACSPGLQAAPQHELSGPLLPCGVDATRPNFAHRLLRSVDVPRHGEPRAELIDDVSRHARREDTEVPRALGSVAAGIPLAGEDDLHHADVIGAGGVDSEDSEPLPT